MSLKERLSEDLKQAMRERDERRRNVLRFTMAALHNAEIDAGKELDEAAETVVLVREAKRRRETIDEFRRVERPDRAQREEEELAVLEPYLPAQVSRDEIAQVARDVIQEVGASGPKDIGKVMPVLMQRFQGRAAGREVSEAVRELLAGS
ncbi:MAG: GatB/YqeY domain-containing protein [Dehalococcoidia bacterium]|nr:GatB/YqeY domain-containing protein [Dehalococcoidia bacterium]